MRLTPLFPLMLLVLGCKLDNPAFEGDEEFGDDQGTIETQGDEQDVGSTTESGDADQGSSDSNTLDGSSTNTSSDDASTSESSSDDASTSESSSSEESSSSSEESSSDTMDTVDTVDTVDTMDPLDGPIEACPITDVVDCKTCIQATCCFDDADLACIDGNDVDCGCVLDCLIDTNAMVNCGAACEAGDAAVANATAMYTCASNFCDDWCL